MGTFDFSPLWRSSIGFDHMLDLLDEIGTHFDPDQSYPPYNIEKTGEDAYRISVAAAGFAPDELNISAQPNLLVVSGKKTESERREYLYRGIPAHTFERQFTLADYVHVKGATLKDGVLMIDLVREVPEAMRPRRIEIASGGKPQAIENKRAA